MRRFIMVILVGTGGRIPVPSC